MKKYVLFVVFLLIVPILLNSCKKDSDEKNELISEVGTWNLSDVEYYYDGKLLDYKGFEIEIWPTQNSADCYIFVCRGDFTLNGDGTGKAFGIGEFKKDELDITYTREGNRILVSLVNNNGVSVTLDVELKKGKMVVYGVNTTNIYGWAPYKSDEVSGSDGKCTHTLRVSQIYIKQETVD